MVFKLRRPLRLSGHSAGGLRLKVGLLYRVGMSKVFRYEGGPKDGQSHRVEESSFPEKHEGGEYRSSGTAHGIGTATPDGPFPEADRATAV